MVPPRRAYYFASSLVLSEGQKNAFCPLVKSRQVIRTNVSWYVCCVGAETLKWFQREQREESIAWFISYLPDQVITTMAVITLSLVNISKGNEDAKRVKSQKSLQFTPLWAKRAYFPYLSSQFIDSVNLNSSQLWDFYREFLNNVHVWDTYIKQNQQRVFSYTLGTDCRCQFA